MVLPSIPRTSNCSEFVIFLIFYAILSEILLVIFTTIRKSKFEWKIVGNNLLEF